MEFKFAHFNYNVFDLEKSIEFYKQAVGLEVKRSREADDKSFKIVYLGNDNPDFMLELTWLRDWEKPYNLGDNEIHLAFVTEDFEGAFKKHSEMGCVCYENKAMGIYFISDPDGYWVEIVPAKK